jgi:hypothetical protein
MHWQPLVFSLLSLHFQISIHRMHSSLSELPLVFEKIRKGRNTISCTSTPELISPVGQKCEMTVDDDVPKGILVESRVDKYWDPT